MSRLVSIVATFFLAGGLSAAPEVAFVSPQTGAQAIGPQWIEVTTTAAHVDRIEFRIDGVLVGAARVAPWKIAHDFGSDPSPHTILATAYSDGYRTITTATVRTAAIGAVDAYNVDLVEVPVRVRTSGLLHPSDVRLRENGVLQTVREVQPQRADAQFVFVIDRSLSMGGGKLPAALAAIDAERGFLRTGDTVTAILFNHKVDRPVSLGRRERLSERFDDLVPSGGTSLRDAVASAPHAARTYTIVITDGGDRNSVSTDEQALRRISGARTVVDSLILGGGDSPFLERAAKNTGGVVVRTSARSLRDELHRLIADINSRYTISYQSHGTSSGWRTIAIEPARRGVQIVSGRKGYFAE